MIYLRYYRVNNEMSSAKKTLWPYIHSGLSNARSGADSENFIAKLLLGNPVVDVTLFKIEFCTKICVGFLGTYP